MSMNKILIDRERIKMEIAQCTKSHKKKPVRIRRSELDTKANVFKMIPIEHCYEHRKKRTINYRYYGRRPDTNCLK